MSAKLQAVPKDETANGHGQTGHGGARDGAGRKPKALRYADELAQAENKIIAALPDVIDGLIRSAKGGDVAAARYLLDRVFGRVKEQSAPPADDRSLPYSEEDAELATREKQYMSALIGSQYK